MTQSFLGTRKILEAYKGTQRVYAVDTHNDGRLDPTKFTIANNDRSNTISDFKINEGLIWESSAKTYGNGGSVMSGKSINLGTATTYSIQACFKIPSSTISSYISNNRFFALFGGFGTNRTWPQIQYQVTSTTCKLCMLHPDSSQSSWSQNWGDVPNFGNTWVAVRMEKVGDVLSTWFTYDFKTWTKAVEHNEVSGAAYGSCEFAIGSNCNGDYNIRGFIDLKNCFLKVDGELVWGMDYGVMPTT